MKMLLALALAASCFSANSAPIGPVNELFTNQYGEKVIASVTGGNYGFPYLSSKVTLTAAQVIALNVTPIQLVAAVTGKVIQVSSCQLIYTKGSAAFTVGTGSDVIGVRYKTINVVAQNINETGFIDQAASKTAQVFGAGAGGVSITGTALEIYSNSADTTVGTGSTVSVQCFYGLK